MHHRAGGRRGAQAWAFLHGTLVPAALRAAEVAMRPTDTAGVADPPVRVACTVPPCMPCPHVHSATQVTPAAPAAAPAAAAGEKRGRPVARDGSPTGEPRPFLNPPSRLRPSEV
jgi:hypothetical protein